jgi:two-component system, chemotaxis family, chemotaxis protein CheY
MSRKYKVLVVDDSAAMRMLIAASLQDSEFEVVAAAKDGQEALQYFKDTSPDMVLLDIVMPGMSGVEALGHIMALDNNAVVIMASSMGTEDAVQGALQAGAKNFLQKPIEQEAMLKVLRNTVKSFIGE